MCCEGMRGNEQRALQGAREGVVSWELLHVRQRPNCHPSRAARVADRVRQEARRAGPGTAAVKDREGMRYALEECRELRIERKQAIRYGFRAQAARIYDRQLSAHRLARWARGR